MITSPGCWRPLNGLCKLIGMEFYPIRMPAPKFATEPGGLYLWGQARQYSEVILVEGLFDYVVLWQAGFHNVTCSMGNHLHGHQYRQLTDGLRTAFLPFYADTNGRRQQAAQSPARRPREQRLDLLPRSPPHRHDPNSLFVH